MINTAELLQVSEPFQLEVPIAYGEFHKVERELRFGAHGSSNGCQGFRAGNAVAASQLPRSRYLAEQWSLITHAGEDFMFDGIQFSDGRLVRSAIHSQFIGGANRLGQPETDNRNTPRARVRQIIVNLHSADRHLLLSDREIDIPHREPWENGKPLTVYGLAVEFSSSVAYATKETEHGYFLASWRPKRRGEEP